MLIRMRLLPALVLPVALTLTARAQTDAMPPEHNASAPHTHTMGAPSTSLTVATGIGQPLTPHLADLRALPQQTITVHNAHSNADETYTGPLLSDVLALGGVTLTDKTEHPMLHQYLIATGTDKYWVLYSLGEVHPGLHNAKVIVAIARAGQPLTTAGQFELIDNIDVKPARWVHNLTSLTLHTPTE
jgi:hypothetical protein